MNVKYAFGAIIGGVLILVIGLVLADVILSTAATSGGGDTIASFSGAKAMNDLIPLVYYASLVTISLGLIGGGAAGVAGRGPLGSRQL